VEAWAEVDGERTDWAVGKKELELTLPPGAHRIAVRMIERRAGKVVQDRTIYDKPVRVESGLRITLDMPTK
jgi:hypothetical protein